jgi:cytochrome P450
MSTHPAEIAAIPAHVPPHLVRYWRFETAPGADRDPHLANKPAIGNPDIYYSPTEGTPGLFGNWVVTRVEHIREAYLDTERFSSRKGFNMAELAGEDWDLIPVELDPPEHGKYRTILAPLFAPKRINTLEPKIRKLAVELIDQVAAQKGCDFEASVARPLPVSIFLELVGLPVEETHTFLAWAKDLLHGQTLEQAQRGARAVRDYMGRVLEERRRSPGDDVLSHFVHSRVGGEAIDDRHLIGFCMLFFVAGLDTVTSQLNFAVKHLAEHPADQELLRADPALIPKAVEETLRAYTTVPMGRIVSRDIEFHGVQMRKGDRVVLAGPLGARDPAAWHEPDKVDFNRKTAGHVAFGYGPHLCLGMHLGRLEMRIAIEEWLRRVPAFTTDPDNPPLISARAVWGFEKLPLRWD